MSDYDLSQLPEQGEQNYSGRAVYAHLTAHGALPSGSESAPKSAEFEVAQWTGVGPGLFAPSGPSFPIYLPVSIRRL